MDPPFSRHTGVVFYGPRAQCMHISFIAYRKDFMFYGPIILWEVPHLPPAKFSSLEVALYCWYTLKVPAASSEIMFFSPLELHSIIVACPASRTLP